MEFSPYHEGERLVQMRVGVAAEAARIGRGIHDTIPPTAAAFLGQQRMLIVGSVGRPDETADGQTAIWASLLTGEPGFVRAVSAERIRVEALPVASDPLLDNLSAHADIGLLAIDLAARQRMRVNGLAVVREDGIEIAAHQVYANCPKYIQSRDLVVTDAPTSAFTGDAQHGSALTPAQRDWIAAADTFFIASHHSEGGADVSHRGGQPGFIHVEQVENTSHLLFPDYSGNRMFQTLGNLTSNPRAGLLFIDFETGATLQLTGTTVIHWDEAMRARFVGAQRVIGFHIERTIETPGATALRWAFGSYSPANPVERGQ
ncbi:MAG: pyridoxamine 5'-phosphate oxidase family protein [Chloroflexota bacterium]|nr:pyridoxamine 5'-phosphate oxidase family protein [Chloroflexota bacterium]